MKTSNLVFGAVSLEIPWPVVVLLAFAALAFLWLILRKGFILHFKGRDKEIEVSTRNPPGKPEDELKRIPAASPVPKSQSGPPTDADRAA